LLDKLSMNTTTSEVRTYSQMYAPLDDERVNNVVENLSSRTQENSQDERLHELISPCSINLELRREVFVAPRSVNWICLARHN
jgi:hypothetical protein